MSAIEGGYHKIVTGDGRIHTLAGYDQITAHTFKRNTNTAGIACACMGGTDWEKPPTSAQVATMCREAAELANQLGWTANDITINRVMTHAEAAANRDFPELQARLATGVSDQRAIELRLPHANYGPSGWADGWPNGTFERWDFFQVKKTDPKGSGGDILRQMIREFMGAAPDNLLDQAADCPIFVDGQKIAIGQLLPDNRCYARVLDLIDPFDIQLGKVQGGTNRFINLVSTNYKPRFLADSPLVSGFPTVDIYLNRPVDSEGTPVGDIRNPVKPFMGGVLIEDATYVLVSDFCDELGISTTFKSEDKSLHLSKSS